MGRYNLSAQKVHAHATQLLQLKRLSAAPAWFDVVGNIPSSEVLTRKPMQKGQKTRKASKLFRPLHLEHKEDKLRWEFFNDHPWELARPRIVLENDGRDIEKWDWSHPLCRPQNTQSPQGKAEAKAWEGKQNEQACRPLNGEAVVQRQRWLMQNDDLAEAAAYDKARKEFYRARHAQEVEQRVAREEATFYGGIFGMSAIEVGMQLEDKAYENWREWAAKQIAKAKQLANSTYTGDESDEMGDEDTEIAASELLKSLPSSNAGQEAFGGAAIHP